MSEGVKNKGQSKLEQFAGIKVVGVGGAGCNAVTRMIATGLKGVEFIAINTDAQALFLCDADQRIHIGGQSTRGLGAGSNPDVGRAAVEENAKDISAALEGADLVFIAAGMGGGTGTGASPVVADLAKKAGALTVAVITRPFTFEGKIRAQMADIGIARLGERVDALITLPNDRLLRMMDNRRTSMLDAFKIADDVLRHGVQGISDIITVPGVVNVDFADIQAIMAEAGSALMGIGSGRGDNRAVTAARAAILSPLLETSIDGARGVLFNITGSPDLALSEVGEAADIIASAVDPDARIIFGAVIDERMHDEVRITVIATGFTYVQQAAEARRIEEKASAESAAAMAVPTFSLAGNDRAAKDELETPAWLRKGRTMRGSDIIGSPARKVEMKCPYCRCKDSKVLDSRLTEEGTCIRRRRECTRCSRRFTTYERFEELSPVVVKKDMRRERFERRKILDGVLKACEKRPIGMEQKEAIVTAIEREIRNRGESEVSSVEIGEMVMRYLKDTDEVAYVRFASVYKEFKDVSKFVEELQQLEVSRRRPDVRPDNARPVRGRPDA